MIKRYKEYIQEALIELLNKKTIKEISITDLTEKAGIARSTFYRYYSSLDEVIDDYKVSIEEAEKKLESLLIGDPKKTIEEIKTSRD